MAKGIQFFIELHERFPLCTYEHKILSSLGLLGPPCRRGRLLGLPSARQGFYWNRLGCVGINGIWVESNQVCATFVSRVPTVVELCQSLEL
jgi:hypothetical protein